MNTKSRLTKGIRKCRNIRWSGSRREKSMKGCEEKRGGGKRRAWKRETQSLKEVDTT